MDDNLKSEKMISIDPSWVLQTLVLLSLGVSSWFFKEALSSIREEMQFSRVERAQLRSDLSALEVGLRGDRFTRSDWERESQRIENQIDDINKQLREIREK